MESQMEEKQQFLRNEILEKGYNPQEFIQFMSARLSIGDDLSKCTLKELKSIVLQFIEAKGSQPKQLQQNSNSYMESISPTLQLQSIHNINQSKSIIQGKPKLILFEKYNFMEPEFQKTYQSAKIIQKYQIHPAIKCEVFDPQRKNVGGFFGIGATSFLEFQIKTYQLDWLVGRRYSDFIWLRNLLLKLNPTQIIPPIPQKKASKKTQRHVEKRMRILEYFLNDVINIPQFLNNKFVEGFLSLNDPNKFQQLKNQSQKIKNFQSISQIQTKEGQITVKLNEENKVYLQEMQKLVPEIQRIYKQITRQSKGIQDLYTQQVNSLYQIGNMFAQLHEKSRDVLNKLPKSDGLKKLNDIYITLNNMMIQWGNIIRNQHQFLEKNFNTFFKYVRNQLHGYNQVFASQTAAEEQFAKVKINLDKKKEKIYNLFDAGKWEVSKDVLNNISKEVVHEKAEAFKIMLPKENAQLEKLKLKDFMYISQLRENGNRNFNRCGVKFCENFKEFAIKIKVNTQQLGELWLEMGTNFSGTNSKAQKLIEAPVVQNKGDEIYDD